MGKNNYISGSMPRGKCTDVIKEQTRRDKIRLSKIGSKNPFYGKTHTKKQKKKWSEMRSGHVPWDCFGEKNPTWKGALAKYDALHDAVKRKKKMPESCENCGRYRVRLELALKDHSAKVRELWKYSRNPDDYTFICHYCHESLDGRIKRLSSWWKNKKRNGERGNVV